MGVIAPFARFNSSVSYHMGRWLSGLSTGLLNLGAWFNSRTTRHRNGKSSTPGWYVVNYPRFKRTVSRKYKRAHISRRVGTGIHRGLRSRGRED